MAIITGNDSLSLEIIEKINQGTKVKDIPLCYNVSSDQAKRLSRYNNMLRSAKGNLSDLSFSILRELGLKSLALSQLFKTKDWEGLEEILSVLTKETTRADLANLLPALISKRQRIKSFQFEVDQKLSELEHQSQLQQSKLDTAIFIQNKIEKQVHFLSKYEKKVKDFLIDHLGVSDEGHLCLAKRLDYSWQKSLQKKGIITFHQPPESFSSNYDQWMEENKGLAYKYTINNLDALADELPKRWQRGWDCAWNYEKESARAEKNTFKYRSVPVDPGYRNIDGLSLEFRLEMANIQKEIELINHEKKKIQKEIINLRKTSPQSFIEQVEASNKLSTRDLKRHGELQDKALKWLFQKGYSCVAEMILDNGKRIDVIGYNDEGHIIGIEVKASKSDYLRDDKWESYLDYCDEFYFLLSNGFWYQKNRQAGLLEEQGTSLQIKFKGKADSIIKNKAGLIFSISRSLSKKVTYGY